MTFFQRFRIFQKLATGVLILFFGIMGLVIVLAYSRPSGSTGLDMSKIGRLRAAAKEAQISTK
jgi:hypothetical protein